ncbi:ArsR family transcriptional regulator [Paenibacillus selenitireducens]|uniref:ArsR family transcriptional regulator n=1 Tax=Paenibacillus selenitireducens TaxID=1324314 RepID=A0A1T2X086_9BACL|nr:ArsR family transcriptional regulator [Paenibacillus selenitireducens]OPA73290.1 ArsR family transcriptional regulator [Paenibacillus selenitireducens]
MLELIIDESERLRIVAHALSSDIRINIIKLLNFNKENIVDIAEKLNLPVSTVASNIKVLEGAGLIVTEVQAASRGTMKLCTVNFNEIHMNLNVNAGYNDPTKVYQIDMPVGCYTDCEIHPTCGLINDNGIVKPQDEPSYFFHPGRVSAQLIWFHRGYVDYKFPVTSDTNMNIKSIQFSMELCSEAPGYDHNWPSDITVWINDTEIGTWTCPGDFGDRRGKLNPLWLPDNHTQYGLLKTWKVDNGGSYLDDVKISDIRLPDISFKMNKYIKFRIGIKPYSENIGGINLFGKEFGDYSQDIIMRIIY